MHIVGNKHLIIRTPKIVFLLVLPSTFTSQEVGPHPADVSTYHRCVHVPVGVSTSWEYVQVSQAHLHPEDVTMCLQVCPHSCRCVHISLSLRMGPDSHDLLLKSDGHCPVLRCVNHLNLQQSVVVAWFISLWSPPSNGHEKHEKNHWSSEFDNILPKDIYDIWKFELKCPNSVLWFYRWLISNAMLDPRESCSTLFTCGCGQADFDRQSNRP